jgi:hypothetical protein
MKKPESPEPEDEDGDTVQIKKGPSVTDAQLAMCGIPPKHREQAKKAKEPSSSDNKDPLDTPLAGLAAEIEDDEFDI